MAGYKLTNENKKSIVIAAIMILVGIAMAVVSWQILPASVATQFAGFQTGAPALPKFFAVLLPFAITFIFSILSMRQEEATKYAFIGYALNVLFWIAN